MGLSWRSSSSLSSERVQPKKKTLRCYVLWPEKLGIKGKETSVTGHLLSFPSTCSKEYSKNENIWKKAKFKIKTVGSHVWLFEVVCQTVRRKTFHIT
jgi:hypothetical protein